MSFNLYGVLIALGILAAVLYMAYESKRLKLPKDLAIDLALWAVPLAVVFSRLYYVAFSWPMYQKDPLSILRIWEGGLAIYGGVIGGAIGVYLYSQRKKQPFWQLADLVAPGLLLGQAIGRWGNFFNGEAYGTLVTNPAMQFFPVAVFADGAWHLATFFYESVWNLLGVGFLVLCRKRLYQKGHGLVFFWYLVWYGLGRMVIEGLRTDSLMLGSLRVSQGVSVLLIALGGLMMLWRLKRGAWRLCLLVPGLALLVLSALGQAGFKWPGFGLMALFAISLLPLTVIKRPKADGA